MKLKLIICLLFVVTTSRAEFKNINTILNREFKNTIANFSVNNCAVNLSKLNNIFNDPLQFNLSEFKNHNYAQQTIAKLFEARLALRDKFIQFSQQKKLMPQCETEYRKMLMIVRSFEEYVAKVAQLDQDVDVLSGDTPYLLINKKFSTFNLQSGDILISRGNAIVSAAIAQIGDQAGHFSHAALIYIDPATQVTYAIESHIEIGTDVLPIEDSYFHDGKVRVVVYRSRNKLLAKKAAELAFQRVWLEKQNKKPSLYNFAMDLNNEELLFCSQLPYMAYKKASTGQFLLGSQYLTSFQNRKNRSFLNGIGVKVSHTYSPSDIELDKNLDLVAEWRDLGRIHQTHRKDMVVKKIYDWLDYDLNFDYTPQKGQVKLTLLVKSMPLLNKILEGTIAPNITKSTLLNMMMINYVGENMLDDLISKYSSHLDQIGIPMTQNEMLTALENIRLEDELRKAIYLNWVQQNPTCSENGEMSCGAMPDKPHFMDHFTKIDKTLSPKSRRL